jgi:DNA-directed RNA polymerase subunit RPC12/RpoP
MRTFKCHDCGQTWQLPHGQGGMGAELACPECESRNVHREAGDRDQGRRGARWAEARGRAAVRGLGAGRGRRAGGGGRRGPGGW